MQKNNTITSLSINNNDNDDIEEIINIYNSSTKMKEILSKVIKIKDIDIPLLITGETGTGKEILVRIIHYLSNKKNKPFIAINCAVIPSELFESELFGYKKGAFTGANNDKAGFFQIVEDGILFFDEIHELNIDLQSKLLRVIEERIFYPVGGRTPFTLKARCFFACNQNLEEMVASNKFRKDLYFRISTFPIEIPPLRKRKDEIPLICNYYIKKYNNIYGKSCEGISPEVLIILNNHDFPGNIRELKNIIQYAILLLDNDEKIIEKKHLPEKIFNLYNKHDKSLKGFVA